MWHVLIANLALVTLFISAWAHAQYFLDGRPRRHRDILFALLMASCAVATMSLPVEIQPGVQFDLRIPLVAMAGFIAGGPGALIAGILAGAYRLALGGVGAQSGIVSIFLAATCGALFHRYWRGRPTMGQLFVFSACVGLVTVGGLALLLPHVPADVVGRLALLAAALNFASTFLAGFALLRGQEIGLERRLLRAAVAQSPDFFYVKDRQSRFVAVGETVARFHGYARPDDLLGKTDFDIIPNPAPKIFEAEARIMATGESISEFEESFYDESGQQRWFSTSKSALRDADGDVIGLVGVTRDITARKRLEDLAERNHHLVSLALTEMSDGLAMFDKDGYLVLCNQRYGDSFPLTGYIRKPGAHIREILEAVVRSGEQMAVPPDDPQRWIDEVEASLKCESQEEVSFADGRWLQIRTRPIQDGSSLVVVSDVTTIKKAELALLGMTDQLKQLATTDGLTGLLNRRSFDQMINDELLRTGRDRQPLSLLMIDVDRFKAYNDHYGHQAGDRCLQIVATCLRDATLRPGDSLSRYGGEEFAAILPNTDEDGAFLIAERLRNCLRKLSLPHAASEKGIVTVSIGIANYPAGAVDRRDTELVRRADEALYDAKAAGRDRVTGWRGTRDVLPRERYEVAKVG